MSRLPAAMLPDFAIARESPADWWEVEALYDLCFAPGRTGLSSYRLRQGVAPVGDLCLTLRDEGGLLGAAIRYWPVRAGGAPALLLGPVATHPTRQGEGLAGFLIRHSLRLATEAGWRFVILIGDEPYYGRFGFTRRAARGLDFPPPTNPERLLARVLDGGMPLSGAVTAWARDADI